MPKGNKGLINHISNSSMYVGVVEILVKFYLHATYIDEYFFEYVLKCAQIAR